MRGKKLLEQKALVFSSAKLKTFVSGVLFLFRSAWFLGAFMIVDFTR